MTINKWLSFIIGSGLFLLSCEKDPPLYEVDNQNGDTITAMGHGGMGIEFKYPLSSWQSIEPAIRMGPMGWR